jgi:UDP-GlcNAc:undecaprenyl-phosphate GlcNAc-1-phosphate transferase
MILSLSDPLFLIRVLHFGTQNMTFGLLNNMVAAIFTTLCCVGLVNAVNMADGKNGLVIGLLMGWLAILILFAPPAISPLLLIFEAGLVILYILNIRGRVFLGDGGSYGFASALGLLSIAIYNKAMVTPQPHPLTADIIALLFIVPVLDSFRLTFTRMSKGKSPMAADRDHLHHHLLNRFGWPGGLLVYYLVAFTPISISLLVFYR